MVHSLKMLRPVLLAVHLNSLGHCVSLATSGVTIGTKVPCLRQLASGQTAPLEGNCQESACQQDSCLQLMAD